MQPGLVSVMMPAYNAEKYIEQAIKSVLAQSYSRWELIIVNDGSTDDTAAVVARFTDSRIRVFHQVNSGEAAARNNALAQMQGEFLAFLDADDVFLSDHLEVTVAYLQAHPECDGVYTDGYYCDSNGTLLQTLSSRRRGPFVGRVFEEVVRGSDVFGPPMCVVLRGNIIAQYQLKFDPDIVIGPDWDFFTHYADVARFGYIDHDTCRYRVHQTNITVLTGLRRRALDMAKCRIKAVKMENFKSCSLEIRLNVFYDLLVNLLRGAPDQQTAITYWPEFMALPAEQQARLLRLMASKALLYEPEPTYIGEWLRRMRQLNPKDLPGTVLYTIYRINPSFCKILLRAKTGHQADPLTIPPFIDLKKAHSL
jgi:glycosyltransferase involved in cell wall biosynthesis